MVGGSLAPAGLVFRRETPDGRAIAVAFHLPRRVWQVKESGGTILYEARSLRDAVADACGDNPDAPWIRTLEAEITAATGVFVIPAVPYLQAIGLEKEELVQALGLSFTVSTLALAVNIGAAGALKVALLGDTLLALACAAAGETHATVAALVG